MNKLDLKAEEKCGYFISEEMKKVWQIEIDILEQIINICKKHNIKYFANGGTALGTIRHKGFIPWDDDVDVMMKREDYDKFLKVAQDELKEPYFLQCYQTEEKYFRGHIQIRNSSTTAIIGEDIYLNGYNKGIWVDVFPLDNLPDDLGTRKRFLKKIARKKELISYSIFNKSDNFLKQLIKSFISKIYWRIFNVEKAIIKLEKLAQKYDNIDTKHCTIIILGCKIEHENEWFNENIEKDFEYLKISVMKEYDKYLTTAFGNYMEFPKVKSGSVHGKTYFDTEKSYKEYKDEEIIEIAKNINK